MKKIVFLITLIAIHAYAKKLTFTEADGKVGFVAVGKPAMIKIIGEGPGPQGSLEHKDGKLNGTLTVDLRKLTTKIDLRDDHMKNKYLEVGKYPQAEIIFKDTAVSLDSGEKIFKAEFKMHGVTKPVEGKINLNALSGSANFKIKVMDFLDTLPSYAGIKVADDVEVTVDLKAKSQ